MKYSGKAREACAKLLLWTFVALLVILAAGFLAKIVGSLILAFSAALVVLWVLFAVFTLYFFRDPDPRVPGGPNLVVSPAHGKVDAIEDFTETEFMGGPCKRISTFLSVIDVHVQNAPVAGKVKFYK